MVSRGPSIALLALVVGGCSAIVGGPANQLDPLPCLQEAGAPNPCPLGQICLDSQCLPDNTCRPECVAPEVCVGGACRPVAFEICNGLDDNGNGDTDEGLRNDEDADGFFTCDPDPSLVDCVDRRGPVGASIYPGAPEICDGYDNDCNAATLDGSSATAGCNDMTEVCARPVGGGPPECLSRMGCRLTGCLVDERCAGDVCVPDLPPTDCTIAGMECRAGERCNAGTRSCEPIRDLPIGEVCGSDAECTSHVCYPWESLGLPQGPSGKGRCGAPCCDAGSCGAGLVCWVPGTGAHTCMTRAVAGDVADASFCSRRSECSGVEVCRLSTVSGSTDTVNAFTCGPPPGSAATSCSSDGDCLWGLCIGGSCTIPCGSQDDCSVFDCSIPLICDQVGVCGYASRGEDWVTACFVNNPDRGAAGATCTRNADCQEVFCDPSTSRCSGTCCSDSDCGGMRCRPVNNAGWEMRCAPDVTLD